MFKYVLLMFVSFSAIAGPSRYDWGVFPSEITAPGWPDAPVTTVNVDVSTISELRTALDLDGRRVTMLNDITGGITITGSDNFLDMNGFDLTGDFNTSSAVNRLEVSDGRVLGTFYMFGSHILIDNVEFQETGVTDSTINVTTIAIINSDIHGGSTNFVTETTTNLIIANSLFDTSNDSRPGIRVMSADRMVLIDSRFVGLNNSPLRLHAGDPPSTRGMSNVWIKNCDVIGQGPGAFWVNREAGVTVDAAATMRDMLIEDNILYDTQFDVNNDSAADIPLYFDIEFRRNESYNATSQITPAGNGGDTSNGYVFHTSGVNANTGGSSISIPAFAGGYGTAGNPPVSSSIKARFGDTNIRPSIRLN